VFWVANYCLMLSSSLVLSAVGGSKRPPRFLATSCSVTALKAMVFVGRTNRKRYDWANATSDGPEMARKIVDSN